MSSTSSATTSGTPRARLEQSRLPEAFSLEELGEWLPRIWEGAPREDPILSIYAMMDDRARDVAFGLGQRQRSQQPDALSLKPFWKQSLGPPKVIGLMRIPRMVQDWLPDGGRVIALGAGYDPRPYHPPGIVFRGNGRVAEAPPGVAVRQYFRAHYDPRFPRSKNWWPALPGNVFRYEAHGELSRTILFDWKNDPERLVGPAERAFLLPGALAAALWTSKEILALSAGAEMLLQAFDLKAPSVIPEAQGHKLVGTRSAIELMGDLDDWRDELMQHLAFARMLATFVQEDYTKLSPVGWTNPVRPGASFAHTLESWGAATMPYVGFGFDASLPVDKLPPVEWLASRGVPYCWYWPYPENAPETVPTHLGGFDPDRPQIETSRRAPFWAEEEHKARINEANNKREALSRQARKREKQREEEEARRPYKGLGRLMLVRPSEKQLFEELYREGVRPGLGAVNGWKRVFGSDALGTAIEHEWYRRFKCIREWPAEGVTTYIGWQRPDGSTVPAEERHEHAEKQGRAAKRRQQEEAEANADYSSGGEQIDWDFDGIEDVPVAPAPVEPQPPQWEYFAPGAVAFIGPRFEFERHLHPLSGAFPAQLEEWKKRPHTILPNVAPRSAPPQPAPTRAPTPPAAAPQSRSPPIAERLETPPPMGPSDMRDEPMEQDDEDHNMRDVSEAPQDRAERQEPVASPERSSHPSPARSPTRLPLPRAPPTQPRGSTSLRPRSPPTEPAAERGRRLERVPYAAPSFRGGRFEARRFEARRQEIGGRMPGPQPGRYGRYSPRRRSRSPGPRSRSTRRRSRSSRRYSPSPRRRSRSPRRRSPQPRHRMERGRLARDISRRISPGPRNHSPVDDRYPRLPVPIRPPRQPAASSSVDTRSYQPHLLHRVGFEQREGTTGSSASTTTSLSARIETGQANWTRTQGVSRKTAWDGSAAVIQPTPAQTRQLPTTLQTMLPGQPIPRPITSSSTRAVLRPRYHDLPPALPTLVFHEAFTIMLRGGGEGENTVIEIPQHGTVEGEGTLIRLGLPAILMREFLRRAQPGMTVREFTTWMLRNGTPFAWARFGPSAPANQELPLQFLPIVPTYEDWRANATALLQEKPWARAFALAGGISWRVALLLGGMEYAQQVAAGPSSRARRHGEEYGYPADYVWDEAPGEAYDVLLGRSGTFALWPPQDIWDTFFTTGAWTPAHEHWFQSRLRYLQGQGGTERARAVGDYQWWTEMKNLTRPGQRRSIKSHSPLSWPIWAQRAQLTLTAQPVILPMGNQPL